MEEEDYPLNEYDQAFFNHCITNFYDQDSNNEIIHAKCNVEEVNYLLPRLLIISKK
jgi:hypothetical protein